MTSAQVLVSGLGDAFVSSVLALTLAAWLWNRVGALMALVFAVCFCGVGGCAFGLKLIARDLCPPLTDAGAFDFSQGAPSGHAALAGVLFGCAAMVFLRPDPRLKRGRLGAGLCFLALAGVAVTRVTLHTHTIADVAAGLCLAAAGVVLFERALKVQMEGRRIPGGGLLLAIVLVAVLALASGVRLSSAEFL